MDLKIPSKGLIALVSCIVIVGVIYVVYTQFFNSNENNVKIVSMELVKSEEGLNFTVTTVIENRGTTDVTNTQLNFIFVKNNDILESKTQSLNLEKKTQDTYRTVFMDVTYETDGVYKIIASIYLENELLDTKTIMKQF